MQNTTSTPLPTPVGTYACCRQTISAETYAEVARIHRNTCTPALRARALLADTVEVQAEVHAALAALRRVGENPFLGRAG